jgi:hypothetical protein
MLSAPQPRSIYYPLLPSHFSLLSGWTRWPAVLSPHSLRFSPCGWPARPLSPSLHITALAAHPHSPALLQHPALPSCPNYTGSIIQFWAGLGGIRGWLRGKHSMSTTARLCDDKKPRHPPPSGKLQARCSLLPSISLEPGELHAHVPSESWGLK